MGLNQEFEVKLRETLESKYSNVSLKKRTSSRPTGTKSYIVEVDGDAKDKWVKVIEQLELDGIKTAEDYQMKVLFPLELQLKPQIFKHLYKKDDHNMEFLLNNYYYVESHFNRLFNQFEGMFASSDKSRTIMSRLLDFYKDGKEIEFDYSAEYTYHLPQAIMKNPEEVIRFYTVIKRLHGGYYDEYIKFMGEHLPRWAEASREYAKKLKKEALKHKLADKT